MDLKSIIAAFGLLALLGCNTNVKEPVELDREYSRWTEPALKRAEADITAFRNADSSSVIVPYMQYVAKINVEDTEDGCSTENMGVFHEMLKLNKSSILALTWLSVCDEVNSDTYLDEIDAIARILVHHHNGVSLESAVRVRELSEADLILSMAGYTILDEELIPNGDRFAYRIHAIDDESGEFEYHYYDNFDFIRGIYQGSKSTLSDADITKDMLAIYVKQEQASAVNFLSTYLLGAGEFQKLIDKLNTVRELPPISRVNLAKAYLYLSKTDELTPLVDRLVEQKDQGDIHAAAFLVELMIELNGLEGSKTDIEKLLDDIDSRTRAGQGAYLLAEAFYYRAQQTEYKYWVERAIEQGGDKQFEQLVSLLKSEEDGEALLKLATKYHNKGNSIATYELATMYRYGNYVEKDVVKADEMYLLAVEKGHAQAMNDYASFIKNGVKDEADIFEAIEWYKKSAEAGYDDALNQIGYLYDHGIDDLDEDVEEAAFWFKKAAEREVPTALDNLGYYFQYGRGVEKDFVKAVSYYKAGVEAGYLNSYERLGSYYLYEVKDYAKARYWYDAGANLGDSDCMYRLAMLHAERIGSEERALRWFDTLLRSRNAKKIVKTASAFKSGEAFLTRDLDQMVRFYERAIELGNLEAYQTLGGLYYIGDVLEEDFDRAFELLHHARNHRAFKEHFKLGYMYYWGKGVEQDYDEAQKYFSLTEGRDKYLALRKLSVMYSLGRGVEKDPSKAAAYFFQGSELEGIKDPNNDVGYSFQYGKFGLEKNYDVAREYFLRSAEQNSSSGYNNLAELYRLGLGVEKDYTKAIEYYNKSIELGGAVPMYNLGELYRDGHGVEQNFDTALSWMKKSASHGFLQAYTEISRFYKEGVGTDVDYEEAIIWLRLGAHKGSREAQYEYAVALFKGVMIKKNVKEAKEWMRKAAGAGYKKAKEALENNFTGV